MKLQYLPRWSLCFLKYWRVNPSQGAKQNDSTELMKCLTSLKCPLVRIEINIHWPFRETRTWVTLILLLLLLMRSCHQDYGQFVQNTPKTCIYFNVDSTLLWYATSKIALKSNFVTTEPSWPVLNSSAFSCHLQITSLIWLLLVQRFNTKNCYIALVSFLHIFDTQ